MRIYHVAHVRFGCSWRLITVIAWSIVSGVGFRFSKTLARFEKTDLGAFTMAMLSFAKDWIRWINADGTLAVLGRTRIRQVGQRGSRTAACITQRRKRDR